MTNGSVAMLPELFVALIEREYVRRVPFGIVPEMVAVPLPLSTNFNCVGKVPVSVIVGSG